MTINQFVAMEMHNATIPTIAASSFIISQWFRYPAHRQRLRVCKPYFAIGVILAILPLPISMATPPWYSLDPLFNLELAIINAAGTILIVIAAARLIRYYIAERRATRAIPTAPPLDGAVWPPPPAIPVREGGQSASAPDSGDFLL